MKKVNKGRRAKRTDGGKNPVTKLATKIIEQKNADAVNLVADRMRYFGIDFALKMDSFKPKTSYKITSELIRVAALDAYEIEDGDVKLTIDVDPEVKEIVEQMVFLYDLDQMVQRIAIHWDSIVDSMKRRLGL